MPTYLYQCSECGEVQEAVRSIKDRKKTPKCKSCGGCSERAMHLEGFNTDLKNWDKPVVSTSMGVMPSQIDQHRRQHPDIRLDRNGDIIVKNGAEERKVVRELKTVLDRKD